MLRCSVAFYEASVATSNPESDAGLVFEDYLSSLNHHPKLPNLQGR